MAYPVAQNQYDFSMFEMKTNATANVSTAPKKAPDARPQVRVLTNKTKKHKNAVSAIFRRSSIIKAVAILLCCLTIFGMKLYSQAKLDEVNRNISRTQKALEESKAENVRLQMQLNSIVSIEKVEEYAVNTLGMVKIEAGQVEYIDLSEGNSVDVSGNRTVKKSAEKADEAVPEVLEADGGEEDGKSTLLRFWEYFD
jgi:cell division protein FtsB